MVSWDLMGIYPLVMTNIANWKMAFYSEFSHRKMVDLSTAMLVITRGYPESDDIK